MNPLYAEFKRKFSLSMYKNLRIGMGEMSFLKDFVNDKRGDLYPTEMKSEDCAERVEGNCYAVTKGTVKRLFCQFFPFASYEVKCQAECGEVGFCFRLPCAEANITAGCGRVLYTCGEHSESVLTPEYVKKEFTMCISCRPGAFDVYFENGGKPEYVKTFYADAFRDANRYSQFSDGYASLLCIGNVRIKSVKSYIDNGISIADIRPIKYEGGEVMVESGRVYFTASVRMQESSFHGVFAWTPTTAEFQMTGAVFYDTGDGVWRNYLAPVLLYHREKREWYVWVSSFEHEHVLAYGAFTGDPRFGVNIVDVSLMEKATDPSDITVFAGFKGDEDPDLYFDRDRGLWTMAICRTDPRTGQYVYVFFESEEPFEGYRYIGKGKDGAETGGSFVRIEGETFFVCGNGFNEKSEYRVYSKSGMRTAGFNYPDGGFRGWGTVMPIRLGSRTRYFFMTFDRHNGSDYNWSYGNLYCFEAM